MGELAGAVAGVQLRRLPEILGAHARQQERGSSTRSARSPAWRGAAGPIPTATAARASRGSCPTPPPRSGSRRSLRAEGVPARADVPRPARVPERGGARAADRVDKGGRLRRAPDRPTYGPGLCPQTEALVARSVIVPVGVAYSEADCDRRRARPCARSPSSTSRDRPLRGGRLRHRGQRTIHLPALRAAGADVTVFASRSLASAEALRDAWGSGEWSTAGRTRSARDDVDAVLIATPNAQHQRRRDGRARPPASTCSSTSRWRARSPTPTR